MAKRRRTFTGHTAMTTVSSKLKRKQPLSPRPDTSVKHDYKSNDMLDFYDKISTPAIIPRLVSQSSLAYSLNVADELELPPSPVKNGVELLSNRPKGLTGTSSPGGGSRRRIRIGGTIHTTSPLKPKLQAPEIANHSSSEASDGQCEIASGLAVSNNVHEVSEYGSSLRSASEDPPTRSASLEILDSSLLGDALSDSGILNNKRATLEELQSQLEALRTDCEQLEALLQSEAQQHESRLLEDQAKLKNSHDQELQVDCQRRRANIKQLWQRSQITIGRKLRGKARKHTEIRISAPAPWPPDLLDVTLTVIRVEDEESIESIGFASNIPGPALGCEDTLSNWLEHRLRDPVCCRDVCMLLTGISHYFRSVVERAQVMAINESISSYNASNDFTAKARALNTRQLMPHLYLKQFSIPLPPNADSENETATVQYDIDLDWVGDVKLNLNITTTREDTDALIDLRKRLSKVTDYREILPAVQCSID